MDISFMEGEEELLESRDHKVGVAIWVHKLGHYAYDFGLFPVHHRQKKVHNLVSELMIWRSNVGDRSSQNLMPDFLVLVLDLHLIFHTRSNEEFDQKINQETANGEKLFSFLHVDIILGTQIPLCQINNPSLCLAVTLARYHAMNPFDSVYVEMLAFGVKFIEGFFS